MRSVPSKVTELVSLGSPLPLIPHNTRLPFLKALSLKVFSKLLKTKHFYDLLEVVEHAGLGILG